MSNIDFITRIGGVLFGGRRYRDFSSGIAICDAGVTLSEAGYRWRVN